MESLQTVNWTDEEGNHDGGQSCGFGFTIAWQRGPILEAGRNGAIVPEVLLACCHQLEHFQSGNQPCYENVQALEKIYEAIEALEDRKKRLDNQG